MAPLRALAGAAEERSGSWCEDYPPIRVARRQIKKRRTEESAAILRQRSLSDQNFTLTCAYR